MVADLISGRLLIPCRRRTPKALHVVLTKRAAPDWFARRKADSTDGVTGKATRIDAEEGAATKAKGDAAFEDAANNDARVSHDATGESSHGFAAGSDEAMAASNFKTEAATDEHDAGEDEVIAASNFKMEAATLARKIDVESDPAVWRRVLTAWAKCVVAASVECVTAASVNSFAVASVESIAGTSDNLLTLNSREQGEMVDPPSTRHVAPSAEETTNAAVFVISSDTVEVAVAAAVDTAESVELVTVGNVDIVVTTTAAAAAAAAVVLEMLMSVADKRSASRRVGEDLEEKRRERGREGEGQRERSSLSSL